MEATSDRVCYVHCYFCNTILAVGVPYNKSFNAVGVKCGSCTNVLSLNLQETAPQTQSSVPLSTQTEPSMQSPEKCQPSYKRSSISFINCSRNPKLSSSSRTIEKKPRVPSAYNRFIRDEIRRIKAMNPKISHKEAFSRAAKNWAQFPRTSTGPELPFEADVQFP